MRIEIPQPKSMRPGHAVNRLPRIADALAGGNGRNPVTPREAAPGNVSMYDYLQSLKSAAEQSLEVQIQWQ